MKFLPLSCFFIPWNTKWIIKMHDHWLSKPASLLTQINKAFNAFMYPHVHNRFGPLACYYRQWSSQLLWHILFSLAMAQPRMPFVPPKNTDEQWHVSDVMFRVVNWRSLFSCYSSHVHINRGSSLCMKSISLISQLVCLPALHTNRLILSPPLCLSYLINTCTLTHRLMLSVSICQLHTDMTFCLMSLEFKKMKWLILKVLRHSCWLWALMTAVGSPCKKMPHPI